MDGWFYGKSICKYNIINVHGKIGWSIPFHTPLRKSIKISLSKIHIQIYDRPILIGSNISLPTGCCMKFCKFKHKKQTSTCGNTDMRKVVKSSTISHQISQVTTQVITCDQSHHHHHHHHHPPIIHPSTKTFNRWVPGCFRNLRLPYLKLTARPWKMIVGVDESFGFQHIFRGEFWLVISIQSMYTIFAYSCFLW